MEGYEIDYLPAGNGERSADAICLRYGNLSGPRDQQVVVTIDGGNRESGQALVEHVKRYYGTDAVDMAIMTHPDADHASGMREIMEGLKVKQVVMHLPWDHSTSVMGLIRNERVTSDSLKRRAKENLGAAWEVAQAAAEKRIPIVEPFAGSSTQGNKLTILGPTKEYYQSLLANFDFMPGAASAVVQPTLLGNAFRKIGEAVVKLIPEGWLLETLQEPGPGDVSPENNSSAILFLQVGGKKLLITGDAGVPALTAAADYAQAAGISLAGINFFGVPHHGSRRNLGPKMLNRLFGSARATEAKDWTAFISAAKEGAPKHPHKKVTNALRRRGAWVQVTAGQVIRHQVNAPDRPGWVALEPVPFYQQVENDD